MNFQKINSWSFWVSEYVEIGVGRGWMCGASRENESSESFPYTFPYASRSSGYS